MQLVDRLDATFSALADPTRRAILARLSTGEASVLELAKPFAMSQPAISRHLRVLEQAGLISRGRDAQRRPCRIAAQPLAEANQWLERYRALWEESFQKLDQLLANMQAVSPAVTEPESTVLKPTTPKRKRAQRAPKDD